MLTIRKEQMDAMIAAQWRAFVRAACPHCRMRHPEVCSGIDEEQLHSIVENGMRRARSHGFETSNGLMRYLDFVLTLGPEFDRIDWVREILSQTRFQPETRLDLVQRTVAGMTLIEEPAYQESNVPDASWPVPPRQPVPPPPVLLPPDDASMALPPPELWSEP